MSFLRNFKNNLQEDRIRYTAKNKDNTAGKK